MLSLNAMSRESGVAAPLDHFLQRYVRSQLPNAANKMISFRREMEKRKAEQEKWITKLGWGSCTAYQVGDQVRVQNQHTGQWSIKGSVAEVVDHNGGDNKTYVVSTEDGASYLHNGRFIKLRLSKLKKTWKRVRFEEGA